MRIISRCLVLTAAMLFFASAAYAEESVPQEIVVGYKNDIAAPSKVLRIPANKNTQQVIHELRKNPRIAYAVNNIKAHAAWIPNDPGFRSQWNLSSRIGVSAAAAWDKLILAGRPGARGVKIAVIDSGIAYRNSGKYKRSPDFAGTLFADPWDFVSNTALPLDRNGHGTHVAGTIAESANNRRSMAGLAWGATIIPIRVLDKDGNGSATAIEQGIRWAADHGAKIINLSIEFDLSTTADMIPEIIQAIDYADSKGSLVVAAAGNYEANRVAYPAAYPKTLAVGASTDHQCLAIYSNHGSGLDLVAPGGGSDFSIRGDKKCRPNFNQKEIVQVGLDYNALGGIYLPYHFVMQGAIGTSMAAPHVAAVAAMVIASGVIGTNPSPLDIRNRLQHTARPLGPARYYGTGIVDAGRATNPLVP